MQKPTIDAVEFVGGEKFPTDMGAQLAMGMLSRGVDFEKPLVVDVSKLLPRDLISAFFTSFFTRLHEECPMVCGLAVRNIEWNTRFEFQQKNIEAWSGMFDKVDPTPLKVVVEDGDERQIPVEYTEPRRLRLTYQFEPYDLARYAGDLAIKPNQIVEIISFPAPPDKERLQRWVEGKLSILPQATVMVRLTPNDPTTVEEVYAFQLEKLPHDGVVKS